MDNWKRNWKLGAAIVALFIVGCSDGGMLVQDGSGEFGGPGSNAPIDGTGYIGPGGTFVDENGQMCEHPSPCGNCDLDCRSSGYNPANGAGSGGDGSGTGAGEGAGILETDEGIQVDVQKIENHFIWIANTEEGTISKVDTRTFEEVGRYVTGPDGRNNDPSRTSVNMYADVYVGNRRGKSVTKISGLGQDCTDSNGDGVVTTSTGPNNVLPWGQDDCVVWNVRLTDGDIIRAVAAQDVSSYDDAGTQPAVWIGGWDGVAWKLDGDTGRTLLRTTTPVRPYGFALDGMGQLWISSRERAFGRIDTNVCRDEASCNVDICDDAGDTCVKQRIDVDNVPYGITVDHKQRVWLGGDHLVRYDRQQPLGSRLTYVRGPGRSIWLHGIQADLDGSIWASGLGDAVLRFDMETPSNYQRVSGTQGSSTKGIAVDLDGKVWSINIASSDAYVITPGQAMNDNPIIHTQSGLVQPYTYSDMTGSQLRFATDQTGFFRQTFGGCPNTTGTDWLQLKWDADVPDQTKIKFLIRAAATADGLQGQTWITAATTPPDVSPLDLAPVLAANGLSGLKFLQVEAQLTAVRQPDDSHVTPTLRSLEVTYYCGPGDGDNGYGDNNNGSGNGSGGDGSGAGGGDGSGGDGSGSGGSGGSGGDGSGGSGSGSGGGGGGGMCVANNGSCGTSADCCSGVCGQGICIAQ